MAGFPEKISQNPYVCKMSSSTINKKRPTVQRVFPRVVSHIFPKHVDSALPTPATWPSLEGTMREMVEESAFSATLALKITWCHRPEMPHQKGGP